MNRSFLRHLSLHAAILREGEGAGGAGGAAPAGGSAAASAGIAALSGAGAAGAAGGTPPAAAGSTPPPPADPGAGAGDPWFKDLDPAYHAGITAKGWDKLAGPDVTKALADGYFNLEKLLGADKAGNALIPPKADAPQAEKDAFYAKLGRPEKADGYQIALPEGVDPTLSKAATEAFHQLGLTKEQGEKLGAWYMQQEAASNQQFMQKSTEDFSSWLQEKGQRAEVEIEAGRRAIRALGFTENDPKLNAFEKAFGTKGMLDLFAKVGSQMFEASAPGASSSTAPMGGLTADAARSKIATLSTDAEFQAKLLSPNARIREEAQKVWEELFKASSGS